MNHISPRLARVLKTVEAWPTGRTPPPSCLSACTLAQIDQIYSYIEAHDPAAAIKVKARIKRSIDRLAHRPYPARSSDRPDVRVLTVSRHPYIVLYSVNEAAQQVRILRVRHTAQDPAHRHD
jgi:plasmid stabilization system protein ParE